MTPFPEPQVFSGNRKYKKRGTDFLIANSSGIPVHSTLHKLIDEAFLNFRVKFQQATWP